jgi:hypothetical protein
LSSASPPNIAERKSLSCILAATVGREGTPAGDDDVDDDDDDNGDDDDDDDEEEEEEEFGDDNKGDRDEGDGNVRVYFEDEDL